MQNELDDKMVAGVIDRFYAPGSIIDYDLIITFDDFKKLFPEINMPGNERIKAALIETGFDKESRFGDGYFVVVK